MPKLSLDDVKKLIQENNESLLVTDRLLLCLVWKESGFNNTAKNVATSATGLIQITKDGLSDVNANTPNGVHFEHADMTDAAKNIQCGTYYLDMRIKRAGGGIKAGIERFGTGSGYADNIQACEKCLEDKWTGKTADQQTPCLFAIHS